MHARATFLSLLAATSLVACSGADGGAPPEDSAPLEDVVVDDTTPPLPDGTPVDGTPVDSTPPPADVAPDTGPPPPPPIPGAVYGAKCTGWDANEQKAWEQIAIVRGKAKMGAIDCITTIQAAARAHAKYITLNGGTLTHTETSGKPGFTGVNFSDRLKAAGFTGPGYAMFEVVHSIGDAQGAILGQGGWINTLYHRIPFVSFGAKGYGFGADAGKFATTDFSSGGAAPSATTVSTWPVNGDTGIWTTFRCASEIPNPLPGQTTAGYPISLTGASALTITTHTITGPAGVVDHVMITSATDAAKFVPNTQVYLIPKSPLAKSSSYSVSITGNVGSTPFTQTFSFTTGTT